jgi:hypothetical protein
VWGDRTGCIVIWCWRLETSAGADHISQVRAAGKENQGKGEEEEEKKSLFTRLTDALASAAVRSNKDAALLQEARQATKLGDKMSRE